MARTKASRMAAADRMPNFHRVESLPSRAQAARHLFANPRPLVIELGCGKGESLVAMARQDPSRNYLGVDLKSARLYSAAEAASRQGLDHVQLLLAPAARLPEILEPESVCEVWIPFPDPIARGSKAHKRLVSPEHLAMCRVLMQPGARLHVKSDDPALFAYARRSIDAAGFQPRAVEQDLHRSLLAVPMEAFMSTYERRFVAQGRPIHYLCSVKPA